MFLFSHAKYCLVLFPIVKIFSVLVCASKYIFRVVSASKNIAETKTKILVETKIKVLFCLENKKYFFLLLETTTDMFLPAETKQKIFFCLRKHQKFLPHVIDKLVLVYFC